MYAIHSILWKNQQHTARAAPSSGLQAELPAVKPPSQSCSQKRAPIPINADEIGHQLLKSDSPVIDELTEAFGQDILDASGDVSRKKLGAIVFKDKAARERLNTILPPADYPTFTRPGTSTRHGRSDVRCAIGRATPD